MEPQGPLDPQIYWRRRMAAGGGALVLLIVLIIIIAVSCGGGSGSGSDDPEDTAALPVTTSSAAPSTSAESSKDPEATESKDPDDEDADDEKTPADEPPPGHCSEDVLAVTVTPDQANYAVGDQPKFVMAITNSGITECDVDVSEHLRGITVTTLSGDPVWALWDCNEPVEEEIRTLTPERRQISYETAWAGSTSVHGCTPEERQPVEPGEYAVTANLGTLTSAPVTFNVA